jgi:Aminotransferase class-III
MPTPLPPDWTNRLALDRAHPWHHFTQMQIHEADPPVPVVGGEGCDLLLANGERVLDGISSWWTCLHGHDHPRRVSALERQAAKLDHVMFAGYPPNPPPQRRPKPPLRPKAGAIHQISHSPSGSRMCTDVPLSSWLSRNSSPPCAMTIRWQTARPRPVPPPKVE